MKRIVVWKRLDTLGIERAEIELDPLRLEGDVILCEDGSPYFVSYRVQFDAALRTQNARILVKRAGELHERTVARSANGEWTMNGVPADGITGLADIDLSITPSTNTPPLRRLALKLGAAAQVTAAWVRFPDLDIVPLRQIYRRVERNSYEYEAPDLAFRTNLECDGDGIVREYGGLWQVPPNA